jgi:hypothetical protein
MDFRSGEGPHLLEYKDDLPSRAKVIEDEQERKRFIVFIGRLKKNVLTYMYVLYANLDWEFVNFFVSSCYSCCDAFTVWVEDKIVYPVSHSVVESHEMMPASVKADFIEAGSIVDLSPRGAAALARLCIQKLMKELGESGDKLNGDIAALVKIRSTG